MARPLRLEYEGAWYHVMNRGAGHCTIFHDDGQRQRILDLLGRYSVEARARCLMGNYDYLLLHTPQANLSLAMRHLHGVYAGYFNRTMRSDGALFRGRSRSIVFNTDVYPLPRGGSGSAGHWLRAPARILQ